MHSNTQVQSKLLLPIQNDKCRSFELGGMLWSSLALVQNYDTYFGSEVVLSSVMNLWSQKGIHHENKCTWKTHMRTEGQLHVTDAKSSHAIRSRIYTPGHHPPNPFS